MNIFKRILKKNPQKPSSEGFVRRDGSTVREEDFKKIRPKLGGQHAIPST